MATLGSKYIDMADLLKRSESDDDIQIGTVIELLAETNPILDDAIALECNLGTRHLTTVRTGLPSVAWGKLYQGIPQSKSSTAQVEDTTGFVEGLSTIDKRVLDLAGANRSQVRLSEAQSFLESLNQEVAETVFYGDTSADPEKFLGLTPRFNDPAAPNGGQLVNGGGDGDDNTSIWIVTWGESCTHLLYPKGTRAGVSRQDMGTQRVTDSTGAYYVEEELFHWDIGLTVRDWRQVVRICNVDVSALAAGTLDVYALLRKGFWRLNKHRVMNGTTVIYANANVLEAMDAQSTPTMSSNVPSNSTGSLIRLRAGEQDGKEVMSYRGFPVRQVDAIKNDEAKVTFA